MAAMLILAFDTTSDKGGVGIFRDAECLALLANEGPANRYSIALFEMVEQTLAQVRLGLCDIELFAAANGPGSFTGIRVGLAAARAWGKAFGRKVRGVSVLEALVNKACLGPDWPGLGTRESGLGETSNHLSISNSRLRIPEPDWLFPILDARRGEFFVGSFRRITDVGASGAGPLAERRSALHSVPAYEPADTGWVLKPNALRAFLEERAGNALRAQAGVSAACLVRAHDQAAIALRASLPAFLGWQQIAGPLMDSIAAIARREEQSNIPFSDTKLDAYYIRRPDAEINWKD
jgi:tRNA threonylcarbamoyl adenosine modification protein YeaZ